MTPDRELRHDADLGGVGLLLRPSRRREYFGVARIGRDQVEDYAKRRGIPIEQAEK